MKYFKNTELAKIYGVSDKAVRNWIEAALKEKNDLELVNHSSRLRIADTLHNETILEELAQQGLKYRNKRSFRDISPLDKFYEIYSNHQIIDIINNLEKHQEIPYLYRCADDGGDYWDDYLQKLASTARENILKATIGLLSRDTTHLLESIKQVSSVRIIDLGVGNGLAVKELIQELNSTGKLEAYIGVDASKNLLDKTAKNVKAWTKGNLPIETHERDFTCERFHDLLNHSDDTMNVVLLLGGTIGNFREPLRALQNIRESLGGKDTLVITNKLDSRIARKFFDFSTKDDKSELSFHSKFPLDLLSITEDCYRVEQFFDKERRARFIQVSLKSNVCIHFRTDSGDRNVELTKGSPILLLRMWEWSDLEMFKMLDEANFIQQRMTKSADDEYILIVAKAGTSKEWKPAT